MLYTLTFAAGALLRSLADAYLDRRRRDRVGAWREVVSGRTAPGRLPLSEVLRLQGVYDQPEM